MRNLLLTIAIMAPLAGCGAIDNLIGNTLPPHAEAQLQGYQDSLEHWEQSIGRVEVEVKDLAGRAAKQAKALDFAAAEVTLATLADRQAAHKKMTEQYASIVDRERKLIEHHFGSATGGVLSMIDPFVPIPLQPFIPVASSLAVMLFSKRARKHTVSALRHVATGNIGEFIKDTMRAIGARHSSEDPTVIMGGAVKEAKAAVLAGTMTMEELAAIESAASAAKSVVSNG